MFGQHGGIKDRVLLVGESVVVGTHLVELAIDVVGRATGRSFEDHVLKKMADTGQRVALVAGPRFDEEAHRRGIGPAVALGNDLQSVRQGMTKKLQRPPPMGESQALPP